MILSIHYIDKRYRFSKIYFLMKFQNITQTRSNYKPKQNIKMAACFGLKIAKTCINFLSNIF